MNPIVAQPNKILYNNLYAKGSYYFIIKNRTKQAKPYNLPTAYSSQRCRTTEAWVKNASVHSGFNATTGEGAYMPGPSPDELLGYSTAATWAVNTAREALVGQLNEEAMLAVNYFERAQSISMMSSRLLQLTRFARWLRRGNVIRAAQELQAAVPDSLKKVSKRRILKKFGDTWLEFHFGWEPLVKDIYNVCDLLSSPMYPKHVTVRGRNQQLFGETKSINCGSRILGFTEGRFQGKVKGKAGMQMSISNPNLYLANRLGLVNPASVAWELIPYSFVVDWFSNVGQFLSEYSDFLGVNVSNAWYGTTCMATGSYYSGGFWYCDENQPYMQTFYTKEGLYSYRYLGLPSVKLGIKPFKRVSAVRAATAISLLLQHLK